MTAETRRAVARTRVMVDIHDAVLVMNYGALLRGHDLLERAEAMARNHEIDQDPMLDDMRAVGMDVN